LRAQSEGAIGRQVRSERAVVDAFGMELIFDPGVHTFGQNFVHFAGTRAEGEAVERMQSATAFELGWRFSRSFFILRATLQIAYCNVVRRVLRGRLACGRSGINKRGKKGEKDAACELPSPSVFHRKSRAQRSRTHRNSRASSGQHTEPGVLENVPRQHLVTCAIMAK
jgi:hypothetical protein